MNRTTPTSTLSFWPTAEQTAQTIEGLRGEGRFVSSLDVLEAAQRATPTTGFRQGAAGGPRLNVKKAVAMLGGPRYFRALAEGLITPRKDEKGWTFVDRQDVIDLLRRVDRRSF